MKQFTGAEVTAKIDHAVLKPNFTNAADYMTGQAINITGGREMH